MKKYQICGERQGIEIYCSKLYYSLLGAKRRLNRLRKEYPENKYQLYVR